VGACRVSNYVLLLPPWKQACMMHRDVVLRYTRADCRPEVAVRDVMTINVRAEFVDELMSLNNCHESSVVLYYRRRSVHSRDVPRALVSRD